MLEAPFLQFVLAELALTDQVLQQEPDSETQATFQYKAVILEYQNKNKALPPPPIHPQNKQNTF